MLSAIYQLFPYILPRLNTFFEIHFEHTAKTKLILYIWGQYENADVAVYRNKRHNLFLRAKRRYEWLQPLCTHQP